MLTSISMYGGSCGCVGGCVGVGGGWYVWGLLYVLVCMMVCKSPPTYGGEVEVYASRVEHHEKYKSSFQNFSDSWQLVLN